MDEDGRRTAVIVGVEEYRRPLDAAEEPGSVRAHDAAKASNEKPPPFEKAVEQLRGRGR